MDNNIAELTKQLEDKREEIDLLKSTLSTIESNATAYKTALEQSRIKNNHAREWINSLQNTILELGQGNVYLQEIAENRSKLTQFFHDSAHDYAAKLQSYGDNVQGDVNKQNEAFKTITDDLAKSRSDFEILKQQTDFDITSLKNEKQRLENDAQNFNETLETLKLENEKLLRNNSNSSARINETLASYESLQRENKELTHKIQKLKQKRTPIVSKQLPSTEELIHHVAESLRLVETVDTDNNLADQFRSFAEFMTPLPSSKLPDFSNHLHEIDNRIADISALLKRGKAPPRFLLMAACKNLETKLKLIEKATGISQDTYDSKRPQAFFKYYLDSVINRLENLNESQSAQLLANIQSALHSTLNGEQLWEQDILEMATKARTLRELFEDPFFKRMFMLHLSKVTMPVMNETSSFSQLKLFSL